MVFADIAPDTFCLDPGAVRALITPRTAAVIPVHLFGHPAAMAEFTALAQAHHLALVEDAAQAHGATLNGRPVGTFGTAGCCSFYPTKNMQSIEGGMVTTADPALARTLRLLRNQGMEHRYDHPIVGTNARMSDVNAAIARSQLRRLPGPDRTPPRERRPAQRTPHRAPGTDPAYRSSGSRACMAPPGREGRLGRRREPQRIPGAHPAGRTHVHQPRPRRGQQQEVRDVLHRAGCRVKPPSMTNQEIIPPGQPM